MYHKVSESIAPGFIAKVVAYAKINNYDTHPNPVIGLAGSLVRVAMRRDFIGLATHASKETRGDTQDPRPKV